MAALAKEIELDACDVVYVYGLGLGYIYEALEDWLKNPNHFLVLMDDQLPAINAFLHTDRAGRLLNHPQIWIYYIEEGFKGFDRFVGMFVLGRFRITALPSYSRLYSRKYKEIEVHITFINVNFHKPHAIEYRNLGGSFFHNYFNNLFAWPSAYLGDGLFGKFRSFPP